MASDDLLAQWWTMLIGRDQGPLTLRLILQPAVATFLAIHSGLRDAKTGRPPFFWSAVVHPEQRQSLLKEGWGDIGKLFLMASVLDVVYQLIVFKWVYPLQVVIVAFCLAVVPYLFVRGLVNRIASARAKSR
jgi:hypothetical protein